VERSDATTAATIGLRESKKARTRQQISNVATRMFIERGFEQVTVAEIAAAADVSVKTVFNYFPAKEDLFFDRADELIDGVTRTIEQRPAGTTVLGALHELLACNFQPFRNTGWGMLRDPEAYEAVRAFMATERSSPALRARRLVLAEAWMAALAQTLGRELGVRADDPRASTLAAMLVAAASLRQRELWDSVLSGLSARTVERRVRTVVDEAFARLEHGFADIDREAVR